MSFFKLARETFTNRNVVAITLSQTLFMFTAFLWWPYRSLFIQELGASKIDLGLIATVETVASLIFQFPGGILADKYGRRKLIILGSVLRLTSPVAFLMASHWTHIIPATIISSAAMLGMPARMALIAESIPSNKRSSGLAVYSTVTSIPMIITSLMGGVIVDYFGVIQGVQYILYASAFSALISIFMSYRFISETMDRKRPSGKEEKSMFNQFKSYANMPRQVWIMTLIAALSMFSARTVMSFMVLYGVEEVGLTTTEWGLIGTGVSLITTLLTTPAGMLAERVSRKKMILASRSISSLATLGFTFSQNVWHMAATRGLGGIGMGLGGAMWGPMGGPVWQSIVADLTPPGERARMMGMMGTIGSLISTPASYFGGYMYDYVSPKIPFQFSFVLDLVGSTIFMFFLKEPEKEKYED